MERFEDVHPGGACEHRATVLIVDDHELVAEALRRALDAEPDLVVMGYAHTVADAVQLARELRPDVVLMDFQLPEGGGSDATVLIKDELPDVAVVMISGQSDGAALAVALEAGCTGFVNKAEHFRHLPSAIRSALAGEVRVPPALVEELAASLRPRPVPVGSELTPRELEVLQLLADGQSTAAIVHDLVLSVHTVRNHVRNVLSKLNAQSRLEAVAIARREGLLDSVTP